MIEQSVKGVKEALKNAVFDEQKTKEATKIALNTLLQYATSLNVFRTKEMAIASVVFAVEQFIGVQKTKLSNLSLLLSIKTRMTIKSNLNHIIESVVKSFSTQTNNEQVTNIVKQSCKEWLQEIYSENGM